MSALESAVPSQLWTASQRSRAIRVEASARHFAGHRELRTARRWLPLFAAALLGACGGDRSTPSAPLPDVSVSTSVASVSPPQVRWTSQVEVSCDVSLSAQATGTGAGTWGDAVIEFYDLRDTTRVLGTVSIQASDLKSAWRQDTISGGQSAGSRWFMTGSTAFGATFRMRYQTAGTTRTSSTSLRCAPPTATVGTPPTITSIAANPSSGTIDVLTPINVPFTANTPAGALYSIVRATGACTAEWGWAENFEASVSSTPALTLGWPCQLGVPIGVEIVTVDAVGNSDTKRVATSVTMKDAQRPAVVAIFWGRQGLDYLPSPYGEYLAPDTLFAEVDLIDNYKFDALFLEVYPFGVSDTLVVRDSVVANSNDCAGTRSCSHVFPVVIRPEWAGNKLQFRYYGRDSQGLMSNVYTTVSGCVQIIASTVNAPTTPNKPLYNPPCIYNPGDPLSARVPSPSRASHSAAPMWGQPSATSRNSLGARRYDVRRIQ